jgi:glycosyltransferase involved in cell wall biosynthesis
MKQRGHNVYIASSGGELLPRFQEAGIMYLAIPVKTKSEVNVPKILRSFFKSVGYIKEKNIDIVHSHTRVTQVLGCLIHYFSGRPHLSTCHGFFRKRFSRMAFPCWGEKIIAISGAVKEHLMKDFKVDDKDIVVIHNGIDVEKFNPPSPRGFGGLSTETLVKVDKIEIKKELGLSDGPVVGIVARLSDVKGHIYLIEAMKIVLENVKDAQLLIVGEGKMKETLSNLTKRLGMERNIFFISSVNDTRNVLSAMDLFALPSLKEGLGLALMEAMAQGLAVIGSDVGGIRNLIKHGYNGLLVKPADTKGLAYAILELLGHSEKREILGRNARLFISQNFSLSNMVLETERVYLECVNAKY